MMNTLRLSDLRKYIVFGCFIFGFWAMPSLVHSAEPKQSFDPHNVQIHVEHAIELPWGKPGFRIEISGWIPNEDLSIYAISPSGEKIELVSANRPLHADKDGEMTVDIDYDRKGLKQGHWVFLVAGKPGAHVFETDLPRVEAPTASRPKWKITFGKADGK